MWRRLGMAGQYGTTGLGLKPENGEMAEGKSQMAEG